MGNKKYIYDPETLSYIPIENTFKSKLKKFVPYTIVGIALGVMSYGFIAFNCKTPTEKIQARKLKDIMTQQAIFAERLHEADNYLNQLIAKDDSLYRALFGAKPLSEEERQAGTGGVNKYEELINSNTPEEIISSFRKLDELVAKMNVQEGSYKELFKKSIVNVNRMQHLPAIIPISNWDLRYIGSGFSPRRFHPILKRWRQHEGIDFIAKVGTEIFATGDGIVKSVRVSDSFGKVVEIDHGFGIQTLYAHMSKFNVKRGEVIKRGHVIGYVGNTGLSAGAHLHYEVHYNGKEVDPVNYFFKDLTSDEYKAVVAQAESVEVCME